MRYVEDMTELNEAADITDVAEWPGIDSSFRLIVVAALRSKQLGNGSHARIEANPLRRRNTTIALEEVKRGLVRFNIRGKDQQADGNADRADGFAQ